MGPPPTGFKTVYVFPGVNHSHPTSFADQATAVICTNVDKNRTATVRVEFFSRVGRLQGAAETVMGPGQARVFTTRNVSFYFSEQSANIDNTSISYGTGRVLTDRTKKLICTAQTFKDDTHPAYIVSLQYIPQPLDCPKEREYNRQTNKW